MSRSQEHELEIAAPQEDVWRAIAGAEGLTRWFVEAARVEPGVGGRFWGSWGEGMEGETRIDVWEPPTRVRLLDDFGGTLEEPMFQEYLLETRGGTTVLRFVHGDIPDSPDWDGLYESTSRGWSLFFRNLRHALEQHPGEPRRSRYTTTPVRPSVPEAWRALLGSDGLALEAEPVEGGRYGGTTADGDRLEGDVVTAVPELALQLTLEPLDRGLLTLGFEGDSAWFTVATFGAGESAAADRVAARILRVLEGPA